MLAMRIINLFALLIVCEFSNASRWSPAVTNADLIKHLKRRGVLKSERVENVMSLVDRANYSKYNPYEDRPQSIGFGATISAPHMHAIALELLKDHLYNGSKALDIGSGSGYLTACMALMVAPNGKVIGIDHIPGLVRQSIKNIEKDQPELFKSGVIRMVVGDGRLGYLPEAKYDAIHVGAAAPKLPKHLVDQLKVGGRLIIPIGREGGIQTLYQIDKITNETIERTPLHGVAFVPLTDKESQVA
ncbi:Protein-L-isoaspartate(D-aspartate) O-methyltransferase-like protein [Dinothrombium tinctorium]|uniref:Protein-L-isoaspartate(D-aspartate) O-methyltransferase n=1 Tax=Dinothrombium tinctorium TaxID=1965070 RepID=A0A443QMP8_9ACAR|nr:Protein-L-isoaspartate(D-aspartate) O-methyltransferase-like protein [Dinothrombium tinctorium]